MTMQLETKTLRGKIAYVIPRIKDEGSRKDPRIVAAMVWQTFYTHRLTLNRDFTVTGYPVVLVDLPNAADVKRIMRRMERVDR